jgi:ligand-binding sensor domain-containing protein/signal transduction histidine kinase
MLLACCAFGLDPSLDSASLHFTHLSLADGLSQSDVRAIAQDRQGFMWFGTWRGGLNRYDGYTFKVYKHDAKDERSLGDDGIRKLYVDRDGVLWVGTNEGVDRYDRETDSFIHYDHHADDATRLPHFFYEDKSGVLWLTSAGGLSRFDQASGRFYKYRGNPNDPSSFGDTEIWPICEDRTSGLLWLGSDEGLTVLDRSSGHFTRYKNNPKDAGSLSSSVVVHIFQDRTGILWISTARGLNRFDPQTHTFIRYLHDPKNPATLSDDYVVGTYEDRAGRFWVTTNNGLNLMDRARGTFARYLHDPNDPSTLNSNAINPGAFYEDSVGTLWIGTRSTGIDLLPAGGKELSTYRHKAQDANSPSSDTINGLAVGSAGELWIGTEAGLDRFDGRTFTHYLADANRPSSLSPGPQRMVAEDANGAVWTGTYGGGLDRLDGQRVKHFRHDPKNPDSPANDNIASLVPDRRGGLWIGVHNKGMDYFDGRHFTHFSSDPANPAGLRDYWVQPLLLDQHGILWIAASSLGLVRFDTNTRKFTSYLLDPTQPGSQVANAVHDIYSDGGSLWLASPTGLFRFDPATGTFARHYTEKDGLASNSTVGILGDAQGNVWVSTVKGLSKFDPRTETFRNYDVFDGLQGNEFSPLSRAKAPDGRLFFGGVNGLSAFYPDKLVDNLNPPPVVLTEFDLFNEPATIGKNSPLQQAVNVSSKITLHHDQSVLRFQFAALDFTAPQKNRYAYKLEGFDQQWQYTDAMRRFASYTNLDPGDYTFRVKASNNDGVWNDQGVALHIRILPPWWNTWWFRAACVAAFLAMIWGAHELHVRQLAQQFNMRLEERVAERTRVARDLHDTLLQSFQALLPLFQVGIKKLPETAVESRKTLQLALDRASEAIGEGRDAIKGLRTSTIEKNDLAIAIRTIGEEFAAGENGQNSISFQLLVEGTPRNLHPILRDEVYRLATEALRNSFRHANAKNVEVEIRYDEKYFRLRVRDDGKGIPADVLSRDGREGHYGLPGMRERAKLVGGKLTIWTELDSGTEIELVIPGAKAYVKSARSFWYFGKRSATETDEKETIERE